MTEKQSVLRADVTLVSSFQDADPMGIVYHGNYFRFFEEARRVLMEKIQYSYRDMQISGYVWPVIDARVKYIKAIPYNHKIQVIATLTEWEHRLRVDYLVVDAKTGERMTTAYTVQVAVGIESEEMCFVSPAIFTDKVASWQADMNK
ncbi:acyl-CoA thioesterase [Photobacterium nomapromontoriensis]|uniref:acyl-CoA thioesterase n=1 Tax=Photobacterium nomapromontoriensis TaxID=2910237 RepID=UPI003D0CA864